MARPARLGNILIAVGEAKFSVHLGYLNIRYGAPIEIGVAVVDNPLYGLPLNGKFTVTEILVWNAPLGQGRP